MFPETDPAVFTRAFWKRPEPSPKGDPDGNMICLAVGQAISAWEEAEGALATLFCFVTRATTDTVSYRAVYRAYGTIHTSNGRREAIAAAAEIHFGSYWDKVRKPFTEVLEAVGHASRRRDDIAHGIVRSYTVNNEPFGAFLTPPEYNQSRTHAGIQDADPLAFLRARYRYTSADITGIAAKFQKLHFAVANFSLKVLVREGQRIPLVDEILSAELAEKKPRQVGPS
jgi:hypothetical protein